MNKKRKIRLIAGLIVSGILLLVAGGIPWGLELLKTTLTQVLAGLAGGLGIVCFIGVLMTLCLTRSKNFITPITTVQVRSAVPLQPLTIRTAPYTVPAAPMTMARLVDALTITTSSVPALAISSPVPTTSPLVLSPVPSTVTGAPAIHHQVVATQPITSLASLAHSLRDRDSSFVTREVFLPPPPSKALQPKPEQHDPTPFSLDNPADGDIQVEDLDARGAALPPSP